jgi:tRNA nucleotidyltransferase (CCA-adding enzyme)
LTAKFTMSVFLENQPQRLNDLLNQVVGIVKNLIGANKNFQLYLVGSRAEKAVINDHRDIDLAIVCPEMNGIELRKIKREIDSLRTLYKIDLIDLERTDREFKNIVMAKAVKIHG